MAWLQRRHRICHRCAWRRESTAPSITREDATCTACLDGISSARCAVAAWRSSRACGQPRSRPRGRRRAAPPGRRRPRAGTPLALRPGRPDRQHEPGHPAEGAGGVEAGDPGPELSARHHHRPLHPRLPAPRLRRDDPDAGPGWRRQPGQQQGELRRRHDHRLARRGDADRQLRPSRHRLHLLQRQQGEGLRAHHRRHEARRRGHPAHGHPRRAGRPRQGPRQAAASTRASSSPRTSCAARCRRRTSA